MRNRFENYINSGYISQFAPTPLDTNMLYNVTKERQAYYDQLQAQLAQLEPKFNYIKPTDYDMGHIKEAQTVKDYYGNVSTEASKMLQEDNLEGAKNTILQAIYNKDMRSKISALESAYLQDQENVKSLNDIKKLDDRQLATMAYYRNRLQGRNFDDYVAGKTNALSSPLLGENPGLDTIISKAGADIQANGYTFADGSVLQSAKDAQGNPTGKYIYRKGDVTSEITYDRASQIIAASVLNNPEVQSYIQARNAWGAPIITQNDKGDFEGSLMNMIQSQALARTHRKSNQDAGYTDMREGFGYVTPDTLSNGISPKTPVINPFSRNSNSSEYKVENGKIFKKIFSEVGGDGRTGSTRKIEQWQEYTPTSNEINEVRNNYIKVINPETNQSVVVHKNSSFAKQNAATAKELNDNEVLNTLGGLSKSTSSTAWSVQQAPTKVSEKKYNVGQMNAVGNNSVEIRKQGKDGQLSYETKKLSDIPSDLEFYESGITIDHPKYGAGYKVYSAMDDEGNLYEIVSNKRQQGAKGENLSYYMDKSDEINEFVLNDKSFTGVKEIDGNYYFMEKQFVLNENPDGSMLSTNKPYAVMKKIINVDNLEDAKKAVNNGTVQFETDQYGNVLEGLSTDFQNHFLDFYGYNKQQ